MSEGKFCHLPFYPLSPVVPLSCGLTVYHLILRLPLQALLQDDGLASPL